MENKVLDIHFNISEEQLEKRLLEKIEYSISEKILSKLEYRVYDDIVKNIERNLLDNVQKHINSVIEKFITDIYNNAPVRIVTKEADWHSDAEYDEVVLKDYILNIVMKSLTVNKVPNSSKTLIEHANKYIIDTVTKRVDNLMKDESKAITKDVDTLIQNTFDINVRTVLGDKIFDILMASDTYKNITNNLKLLSNDK